jgi:hypothetical protein
MKPIQYRNSVNLQVYRDLLTTNGEIENRMLMSYLIQS